MRCPPSILMAGLLILATAQLQSQEPDYRSDEVISGSDLLDRTDRALRVSDESARTWHAGLTHLDTWPATLEKALLEALRPDSIDSRELGVDYLVEILDASPDPSRLSPDARRILTLMVSLLERQEELSEQSEALAEALEQERLAHLETLTKLAALREIDVQIEEREAADDDTSRSEP